MGPTTVNIEDHVGSTQAERSPTSKPTNGNRNDVQSTESRSTDSGSNGVGSSQSTDALIILNGKDLMTMAVISSVAVCVSLIICSLWCIWCLRKRESKSTEKDLSQFAVPPQVFAEDQEKQEDPPDLSEKSETTESEELITVGLVLNETDDDEEDEIETFR